MVRQIEAWRASGVLGQLVRFAIAGGFTTALYSAVYSPLAGFGITSEQVANIAGYFVAVTTGYVVHSRWSFRGHGKREDRKMKIKFFIVQTSGFVLNESFTWLLINHLHGPTWWPLIPAIFVTPLATYLFNRQWVFG